MASDPASMTRPPERIGPYQILDTLGEGGMGTVYLAEQKQPMRRRVALKVVKLGMDSKAVLARFDAERQALSLMEHSCIAQVFDAGLSEQGQPYFVMEYIKGVPITRYCDENRLGLEERIRLFRQVCSGVQHAHLKGVMHRDLKPGNVLVTVQDGKATPKIIDFGLAKAMDHRLVEATIFTQQGQVIGTPEYMSPEQAGLGGLDVDTRTDVYSLGVLLYELLTGELPFSRQDLQKAGWMEIQRLLRESEPPKPSTKITTIGSASAEQARLRGVDASELRKRLRGDLDWIVMKALEKDRTRRYETALELAADLERHLQFEPVLASQPSVGYRVRKFVRRFRAQVIAGGFVIAVVVAGATASTVFWLEAKAQAIEKEAQRVQAQRQEAIAGMRAVEAETAKERAKHQSELATQRAKDAEAASARASRYLAETDAAMSVFSRLVWKTVGSRITDALPMFQETLATFQKANPGDSLAVARSHGNLAACLMQLGRLEDALVHAEQHVEMQARLLGEHESLAGPLVVLGRCLSSLGRISSALPVLERARALVKHRGIDPEVATITMDLAECLGSIGRFEEAGTEYEAALAMRLALFDGDHIRVAESLDSLASNLLMMGRPEIAKAKSESALAMLRRLLPEDHPETAQVMDHLAQCHLALNQNTAALSQYMAILAIRRRCFGSRDHPDVASTLTNLAICLARLSRADEALARSEEALAMNQRLYGGTDHPVLAAGLANVARVLQMLGSHQKAIALFSKRLAMEQRLRGSSPHRDLAAAELDLGRCQVAQGDARGALPRLEAAAAIMRDLYGDDHPDTKKVAAEVVAVRRALDRVDKR